MSVVTSAAAVCCRNRDQAVLRFDAALQRVGASELLRSHGGPASAADSVSTMGMQVCLARQQLLHARQHCQAVDTARWHVVRHPIWSHFDAVGCRTWWLLPPLQQPPWQRWKLQQLQPTALQVTALMPLPAWLLIGSPPSKSHLRGITCPSSSCASSNCMAVCCLANPAPCLLCIAH
jgi:hypothetical protein